jgi:hypothetical protein
MLVDKQDLYHGAVLTQITEHPSFTALNKPDTLYGHYVVNHETRLFVKYLTKESSAWHFRFSVDEMQSIQSDMEVTGRVFLCLVCGQKTICALNIQEFSNVIDLTSSEIQTITVEVPPGGSMHVKGTAGELEKTVKHNSFPDKLFAESLEVID